MKRSKFIKSEIVKRDKNFCSVCGDYSGKCEHISKAKQGTRIHEGIAYSTRPALTNDSIRDLTERLQEIGENIPRDEFELIRSELLRAIERQQARLPTASQREQATQQWERIMEQTERRGLT